VEFALLAPILITLLLGIVDTGRFVFAYIALQDAVAEGALYAAWEPIPESAVIDRVRTSSNHAEVKNATIDVTCTTAPAPGTIIVSGSYDLPLVTHVGAQIFGGSFRVTATSVGTNFQGLCE
jgi:Flp pilus assembly protein TadG